MFYVEHAGGRRRFPLDGPRPQPESVVIEFEGRRFVWHAIEPDEEGTELPSTIGHSDLMTTARTYTHVLADEAELDYEALLSG